MKYSEVDVLNFIEGRFNDQQVADILAQKRIDPELANTIDTMQASLQPYKEAYDAQVLPEMPESLHTQLQSTLANKVTTPVTSSVASSAIITAESSPQAIKHSIPYKWVASFLLAGIAIGFFTASTIPSSSVSSNDQPIASTNTELQEQHTKWVNRVADYQSLYVENTVKSIPSSAHTDAKNLLASLSTREGFAVSIPDLTEFGYEFVRAQELGFEGDTLLQLVYRKPGAMPLAYCLMPDQSNDAKDDLPLQLSQQHNLGVASWIGGSRHNVLVADESPSTLQKIHSAIIAI